MDDVVYVIDASPKYVAHVSMTSLHDVTVLGSRHSPCDLASASQLLVSLLVDKRRSGKVSPLFFLMQLISAFVGVAEVRTRSSSVSCKSLLYAVLYFTKIPSLKVGNSASFLIVTYRSFGGEGVIYHLRS